MCRVQRARIEGSRTRRWYGRKYRFGAEITVRRRQMGKGIGREGDKQNAKAFDEQGGRL